MAHHAPTEFNFLKVVEIEGAIVEVKRAEPLTCPFKVRVDDARGKPVIWEIEGGSAISMMRRTNAAGVRPSVGEKVRVAGWSVPPHGELPLRPEHAPGEEASSSSSTLRAGRGGTAVGQSAIRACGSTGTVEPELRGNLSRMEHQVRRPFADRRAARSAHRGCEGEARHGIRSPIRSTRDSGAGRRADDHGPAESDGIRSRVGSDCSAHRIVRSRACHPHSRRSRLARSPAEEPGVCRTLGRRARWSW